MKERKKWKMSKALETIEEFLPRDSPYLRDASLITAKDR